MADPTWDPEQELVCVCHEVKRSTIRDLAARHGTFEGIVQKTPMCRTCQGCESEIRAILAEVLTGRPRAG